MMANTIAQQTGICGVAPVQLPATARNQHKHTPRRAVGAASDGLPRCEQSDPFLLNPGERPTERHEPCTAARGLVGVSESREPGR